MTYWLLTTYLETLLPYVAPPLTVLGAVGTLLAAYFLGPVGLRTAGGLRHKQLRLLLPVLLLDGLAALQLAIPLVALFAVDRAIPRPPHLLYDLLLGPPEYDVKKLALAAGILAGAGGLAMLLAHLQLRDGGWLREQASALRDPMRRQGELGSATFATPGQMAHLQKDKGAYQLPLYGAFWGSYGPGASARKLRRVDTLTPHDRQRGRLLFSSEDQARGAAAIGAAGSGKSQALILPVLADALDGGQSAIVIDPQGELTEYVEQIARATGHRLVVHDPTEPEGARFNLASDIAEAAEAQAIAAILLPHLGHGSVSGGDGFWQDSARNLLAGCLLRFETLGEILRHTGDLGRLAGRLRQGPDGQPDPASDLAAAFIAGAQGDSRTAQGILAQLHKTLSRGWADRRAQQATDRTDFRASELVEQPAVIVLKCPMRYMEVYGPYLGAVLQKLMLDLDTLGQGTPGGALSRPVKIVIDEFPALGRLDAVVKAVNLFRKRRISIVIAFQSIAQLHDIYGRDAAHTLIAGLALQVVFGACDPATARFVLDTLGKQTREAEVTVTLGGEPRPPQVRVRELLTLDEVITPPKGNCTLLFRYATTTYATQVVMLGKLAYLFERGDWQARLNAPGRVASPAAAAPRLIDARELFGPPATAGPPTPAVPAARPDTPESQPMPDVSGDL